MVGGGKRRGFMGYKSVRSTVIAHLQPTKEIFENRVTEKLFLTFLCMGWQEVFTNFLKKTTQNDGFLTGDHKTFWGDVRYGYETTPYRLYTP